MTNFSNRIINMSSYPVWVVYSSPNPSGGYDIWKVRLLKPGQISDNVDVDFIQTANENITINGSKDYWKIGQSEKFIITNHAQNPTDLYLFCMNTYAYGSNRILLYKDWARGIDQRFWEKEQSVDQVNATIDEWNRLKDSNAPID